MVAFCLPDLASSISIARIQQIDRRLRIWNHFMGIGDSRGALSSILRLGLFLRCRLREGRAAADPSGTLQYKSTICYFVILFDLFLLDLSTGATKLNGGLLGKGPVEAPSIPHRRVSFRPGLEILCYSFFVSSFGIYKKMIIFHVVDFGGSSGRIEARSRLLA